MDKANEQAIELAIGYLYAAKISNARGTQVKIDQAIGILEGLIKPIVIHINADGTIPVKHKEEKREDDRERLYGRAITDSRR